MAEKREEVKIQQTMKKEAKSGEEQVKNRTCFVQKTNQ